MRVLDIPLPTPDTALDMSLVGTLAVLLVAVHMLVPPAIKADLTLSYQAPTLPALLTAAYVHYDVSHLSQNLFGYLIAAGVASLLCRSAGERRWFRVTVVAFALVLPVLVNATSLVVLTQLGAGVQTGRGFSGVAAGFVGFVLVSLVVLVADRYSRSIAWAAGNAIVIVLLLEVASIYTGVPSLEILVPACVGLLGSAWTLVRATSIPAARSDLRDGSLDGVFVGLIVVLLGLFVAVLFPPSIAGSGPTTNIVGHAAGVLWGVCLSGGALAVVS